MHLLSRERKLISSKDLKLIWSREEGLSSIKQVEIINEHPDNIRMEHEFDYIKHWDTQSTFVNAPQRIMQRYVENIAYITKFLLSTAQLTQQDSELRT